VLSIGRAAYSILSQVASPCEIHEMIQAIVPAKYGTLYFPEGGLVLSPLPSKELILGCILHLYHQEMIRAESVDELDKSLDVNNLINAGFTDAFKEQANQLKNALDFMKVTGIIDSPERRNVMACSGTEKEWTFDTITDPRNGRPSKSATLIFCLKIDNGVITGSAFDGVSRERLSDVTGTSEPILDTGLSLMTLGFTWGPSDVMMAGFTFTTAADITHFQGRFRAFHPFNAPITLLDAPDPGDTGTGTGQQT
jgi:hypothetical protein